MTRLGGDEFVLLLYEMDSQKYVAKTDALAVAENTNRQLAQSYILQSTAEAQLIERKRNTNHTLRCGCCSVRQELLQSLVGIGFGQLCQQPA